MAKLHINEFLCFLTVQFKKLDRENLIIALLDAYVYREALEAKNTLIAECKKVSITDSIEEFTIKRVEGKAGALKCVVTDAVDIWTVVDQEKVGKLPVQFVAANPNRLPASNVEKFSLQFLVASIVKLQEQVQNQDNSFCALKEQIENNNNNNKRKLSGDASSFTPKRLQTGVNSFVSTSHSEEAASTSSSSLVLPEQTTLVAPSLPPNPITTPNSLAVTTPISLAVTTPISLVATTPNSLAATPPNSLAATTPNSLAATTPNSLAATTPDSLAATPDLHPATTDLIAAPTPGSLTNTPELHAAATSVSVSSLPSLNTEAAAFVATSTLDRDEIGS